MATLDLNADLGEFTDPAGIAIDEALLKVITSANVACGGHAGDNATMLRVCRLASANGVAVGAQISYVDREGFGRTRLDIANDVLVRQLSDQLQLLDFVAAQALTEIQYVKPHGALYNASADDVALANTVVAAMTRNRLEVPVLTLPGCELAAAADRAGLPVAFEYFADRAYDEGGRLLPRSQPGAVLTDADEIVARVLDASNRAEINSICVHSDTPGAVTLAGAIRDALESAGITLAPFTEAR